MRINGDFLKDAIQTANRCQQAETKLDTLEKEIKYLLDNSLFEVKKSELKRIYDIYFRQEASLINGVESILNEDTNAGTNKE